MRGGFHAAALCALVALAGCSIPLKDQEGIGKLTRVKISSSALVSVEKARGLALRRAAAHAQSKGKPYFLMYKSLTAAAVDEPTQVPLIGGAGYNMFASAYLLLLDEEAEMALTPEQALAEADRLAGTARERQDREQQAQEGQP